MILNYGEHLLFSPAEKFKKPLVKYHHFIAHGTRADPNCCTLIEQSTVDRIISYVPKQLQSFSSQYVQTVIEEIVNVSEYFIVVLTSNEFLRVELKHLTCEPDFQFS